MRGEWILLLPCVGTALMCAALLPGVMQLAPYIGAMDVPNESRRMHRRPVPRCGGMALFVAFWCIVAAVGGAGDDLLALLLACSLLLLMGLADDVYGLPALLKLGLQGVAAMAVVPGLVREERWQIAAVLWICLVVNAHNMIDGIDGLCATVVAWESAGAALLLLVGGDWLAGTVALACLGCCLGYLPFNRHPARVFMGDEGALFLGLVCAWLSLRCGTLTGLPGVALLVCLYPVSDLLFSLVRRILQGKNPLCADRGHFHHLLCDAGLGQRTCCRLLSLISLLSTVLMLLISASARD